MKYMDYPAPIFIDRDDIAKALAGGLVTKAIYLEDPTKAIPVETRPDQPIEFTDLTEEAAIKSATENGRLVAVLRFGDRKPEPDELARFVVPGTVLLPGEQHLPAPAAPPVFQWCGIPLYDPIAGMRYPAEECFTDGGDTGPRLGIGPLGRLGGLNPTDVALEYTLNGRRRVKTSNQVCICVPRFVIRRVDVGLVGLRVVAGPDSILQTVGGLVAINRDTARGGGRPAQAGRVRVPAAVGADRQRRGGPHVRRAVGAAGRGGGRRGAGGLDGGRRRRRSPTSTT